jgi:hypothetical protein
LVVSAIAVFAPGAVAHAAGGAVLRVPGDQPTIQSAIDAANNGDKVLVSPGLYQENLDFKGKRIVVASSAGAAQTVIDGGQNGPVVLFATSERHSTVLQGFTIRRGATPSSRFTVAASASEARRPRSTTT